MTLINIKQELEKTEELIFRNSLYRNLSLNQLAESYRNLIHLSNQFLSSSFSGTSLEELEIRFRIAENVLNVKIEIRERVGLDCRRERVEMERLRNHAQE